MIFVSVYLKKMIAKQSFVICLCFICPILLSNCAGIVAVGATAGAGGVIPVPERKEEKYTPTQNMVTKFKIPKHKRPPAEHKTAPLAKDEAPSQRSKNIAVLQENPPTRRATKVYPKYLSLQGLKDDKIKMVLGRPELIRRDGPAKIWLYKSENCKVHLFFFKDPQSSEFFVNHLEMEAATKFVISNDQCVINIIEKLEKTG